VVQVLADTMRQGYFPRCPECRTGLEYALQYCPYDRICLRPGIEIWKQFKGGAGGRFASLAKAPSRREAGRCLIGLPDQPPANASRATSFDAFVEACAGTGKRTELLGRIISLVRSGVPVERIAAITFTEKAAAELSERVRKHLELAATGKEGYESLADHERALCREALPELDRAAIQTLHSFAQRILTLYPLEAGLPPQVRIMDEVEGDIAFRDRWARFVDELLDDPAIQRPLLRAFTMGLRLKDLEPVAQAFHNNWERIEDAELEAAPEPDLTYPPLGPALEAAKAELGPKPTAKAIEHLAELGPHLANFEAATNRVRTARDPDERDAAEVDLLRLACAFPKIKRVGKTGVLAVVQAAHAGWIEAARRSYLTAVLPRIRQFALEYAGERRADGHLACRTCLCWPSSCCGRTNTPARRSTTATSGC